jgi:hypothetical protein
MAIAPDLRGAALDGRYELEELIGEGTFGRVYRGWDRRLERMVAIKVVKPWWAEDPEWVAVFEREARLLARVNHPGIVQIHDVGHCAQGLYYVSELVAGEDLAARLRSAHGTGLDPAEACALARGLCAALAGAHAAGIVHRDVKPANVLLAAGPPAGTDRSVRVKVADFGVARLAESTEDGASLIVGTPRYMAPEQADGGRVTAATDVYAIGAILFEMLAGRPPFEGRTAVELAVRHREDPVPALPPRVDPVLARVVYTALAKRPADRHPDAGAMGRALEGLQPGPVDATRRAPRRAPRALANPSARRRSAALLALAGLLLGALVLAVLLTGGAGGARSPARRGASAGATAPVEVPLVVGQTSGAAGARLRSLHLRVRTRTVPAPGIRPGTVTQQMPAGGRTVHAHGTVVLGVAEVPRWRPVTTITARRSAAFRILGERWRLLVSASGTRACTLLVFCHSAQLQVLSGAAGTSVLRTVSLSDEVAAPTVLRSGPGLYRIAVHPASPSTRWSVQVEDDY